PWERIYIGTDEAEGVIRNFGFNEQAFFGGGGNDYLQSDRGKDYMFGGTGDDTILAGYDYDWLYGEAGNDQLFGGFGGDHLYGGAGDDRLMGEDQEDTLRGGEGQDTLVGGSGGDVLYGDEGNDWLYGDTSTSTTQPGRGSDTLYGGAGHDRLYGSASSTEFHGGAGNDLLFGGASSSDSYYFQRGDGIDVVDDIGGGSLRFAPPQGFSTNTSEDRILWTDLELTRSGDDLIVSYGDGDRVTVVDQFAGGGVDYIRGYYQGTDLADFDSGARARRMNVTQGQTLSGVELAERFDGGSSAEYEFMDFTGDSGHFTVGGAADSHFQAMANQLDQVEFHAAGVEGAKDSVFVRTKDGGSYSEWTEIEITTTRE
ncbi:MAG: calcium-binding protein, partial [Alphaproteobacteria bacterium]|nr:calcium-binding protein [Alphaproteobacteria bacterium]